MVLIRKQKEILHQSIYDLDQNRLNEETETEFYSLNEIDQITLQTNEISVQTNGDDIEFSIPCKWEFFDDYGLHSFLTGIKESKIPYIKNQFQKITITIPYKSGMTDIEIKHKLNEYIEKLQNDFSISNKQIKEYNDELPALIKKEMKNRLEQLDVVNKLRVNSLV